jgi:hypothetical protein
MIPSAEDDAGADAEETGPRPADELTSVEELLAPPTEKTTEEERNAVPLLTTEQIP